MPSMLAPRKTFAQQIKQAAQTSQVAGAATGRATGAAGPNMRDTSPLAMARRAGPRSAADSLMATGAVDQNTAFLANRTANFAAMGGGMSRPGSSLRPGMRPGALPGMLGMSSQFAAPGSRLRKPRAVQGYSGSGI